jgi:hypothetical protein
MPTKKHWAEGGPPIAAQNIMFPTVNESSSAPYPNLKTLVKGHPRERLLKQYASNELGQQRKKTVARHVEAWRECRNEIKDSMTLFEGCAISSASRCRDQFVNRVQFSGLA